VRPNLGISIPWARKASATIIWFQVPGPDMIQRSSTSSPSSILRRRAH
jgi:hypothetical protein